jgi:hypothetical protein
MVVRTCSWPRIAIGVAPAVGESPSVVSTGGSNGFVTTFQMHSSD